MDMEVLCPLLQRVIGLFPHTPTENHFRMLILDQPYRTPSHPFQREALQRFLFKAFDRLRYLCFLSFPFVTRHVTCLKVDMGDSGVSITPIFEGVVLESFSTYFPIGGRDLTHYLVKLLRAKGYSFTTTFEIEFVVKRMKQSICKLSLDFDRDISQSQLSLEPSLIDFELPDCNVVSVSSERFLCPEILFQPSLIGKELDGLHHHISRAILSCPVDTRKDLWGNIFLIGGGSMVDNLPQRLQLGMPSLPRSISPPLSISLSLSLFLFFSLPLSLSHFLSPLNSPIPHIA